MLRRSRSDRGGIRLVRNNQIGAGEMETNGISPSGCFMPVTVCFGERLHIRPRRSHRRPCTAIAHIFNRQHIRNHIQPNATSTEHSSAPFSQ
jgi:hypothetical protein